MHINLIRAVSIESTMDKWLDILNPRSRFHRLCNQPSSHSSKEGSSVHQDMRLHN